MLKMSKMIFLMQRSKFILQSKVKTILISVTDITQQADKFHGSPVVANWLIYFMPQASFYTPWKHKTISGFQIFSGSIERDKRHEMG